MYKVFACAIAWSNRIVLVFSRAEFLSVDGEQGVDSNGHFAPAGRHTRNTSGGFEPALSDVGEVTEEESEAESHAGVVRQTGLAVARGGAGAGVLA